MPVIKVEMFEGRTTDQKRELVEVLSRETARITGCDVDSIYVILEDVKKSNWGAGGMLCSDKFPDEKPAMEESGRE
ncbi:4-oxalocrotonate tautomerase [Pseudodesulfovibrio sediminis]|uniref:4-oxalocrotonate tautomerase-like domain-containing protein n=1 Tax=Pseudodesulfovibrio sediminis TaxID=2810563 RepID=A0ABN6ESS9_9BACT|nr:4-oxalocrotonate tautomerase [Pseudodesulfovibrio sediminis]BCS88537.1 hypothetical protein PSDVSF_17790 [Pseudodesulfovibrio sediminis]